MSIDGHTPILKMGSTLIATVQVELKDTVADAFQERLLLEIARSGAQGLVLDISALEIVDSYVARVIADTSRMASLMGTQTVLVGMRPEVASTLVRMGSGLKGVHTALNLDEGLERISELLRLQAGGRG
jgi:rsbT antagonist protein RsbS